MSTADKNVHWRQNRSLLLTGGRASGGLILALSNKKFGSAKTSLLLQDEHMLAVEVTSATSKFVVINTYVPVHSHGFKIELFDTISAQLEILLENYSSPVVIAGMLCPSHC
jgi:hypothetical protein